MGKTFTIHRRFRGPDGSGNGGYVAGVVAGLVGGSVEVTLLLPPPLDRPLDVRREDGRVFLCDGPAVVAEGAPAVVDVEPPAPPSLADAEAARLPGGDPESPFPECFVCGPDRGDGLRIFPGPVPDRDLVAAPWIPDEEVGPELVWAAIDCPGAYGSGAVGRGTVVLGRMTGRVDELPRRGEPCIVTGWPLGEDGRKIHAGTALHGEDGRVLARARQTWIVPR